MQRGTTEEVLLNVVFQSLYLSSELEMLDL